MQFGKTWSSGNEHTNTNLSWVPSYEIWDDQKLFVDLLLTPVTKTTSQMSVNCYLSVDFPECKAPTKAQKFG